MPLHRHDCDDSSRTKLPWCLSLRLAELWGGLHLNRQFQGAFKSDRLVGIRIKDERWQETLSQIRIRETGRLRDSACCLDETVNLACGKSGGLQGSSQNHS